MKKFITLLVALIMLVALSATAFGVSATETTPDDAVCDHQDSIYLEYDYCYEDDTMYDLVETCWNCGATFERYVPGTQENPAVLDFVWNDAYTIATATVTVPAGETLWIGQSGAVGMVLTINGEEYGILERLDPLDFWGPAVFSLTNDTAEDAVYELVLAWAKGTEYNPDSLVVNESFELYLPENSDYYYLEWVATESGELNLVVDGENWIYLVNNLGDPNDWSDDYYGDTFYGMNGDSNTYTLFVNEGDQIQVVFGTLDADWGFPAINLNVTVTFTPGAAPDLPTTPAVLGSNMVIDGYYEYVAEQSGTLYFRVTELADTYGDISDSIRDYLGSSVVLSVNGEAVADGYFGFIEVTEGDLVSFLWSSTNQYSPYYGTLELSYENNNPVLGSEERPVEVSYEDCPVASVEIGAGETAWYQFDYGMFEAIVTIKGENAFIRYTEYDWDTMSLVTVELYAENGALVLEGLPATLLEIGNAGAEAAVFEISAQLEEGSAGNPADLILGQDNVAELEENRPDYFYYDWIAPEDGELTITVGGDYWFFYVGNETTYEYSDPLYYFGDMETGVVTDTITLAVSAGDRIVVAVSTTPDWSDPDLSDYTYPAGTVITNASFVAAAGGEDTEAPDDEPVVPDDEPVVPDDEPVSPDDVPPTGDAAVLAALAAALISGMSVIALPCKKEN